MCCSLKCTKRSYGTNAICFGLLPINCSYGTGNTNGACLFRRNILLIRINDFELAGVRYSMYKEYFMCCSLKCTKRSYGTKRHLLWIATDKLFLGNREYKWLHFVPPQYFIDSINDISMNYALVSYFSKSIALKRVLYFVWSEHFIAIMKWILFP